MNLWHRINRRLDMLLQKRQLNAQLDDELRSHLDLQTQENIDAGMKPEEARLAALRQFGWVESVKDKCREQRRVAWLEDLVQDVGFGARMLRKNPGFTTVAMLTIALGIRAVTTQFSLLNGVLLRGLPFPEAIRLVRIALRDPSWPSAQETAPSLADFLEWQRQQRSCEGLAASDSYRWLNVTL